MLWLKLYCKDFSFVKVVTRTPFFTYFIMKRNFFIKLQFIIFCQIANKTKYKTFVAQTPSSKQRDLDFKPLINECIDLCFWLYVYVYFTASMHLDM